MTIEDYLVYDISCNKVVHSHSHWEKGYENEVVQVSFLKILHDRRLLDLRQKNHIFHSTCFDITFTLPMVVRWLRILQKDNSGFSTLNLSSSVETQATF